MRKFALVTLVLALLAFGATGALVSSSRAASVSQPSSGGGGWTRTSGQLAPTVASDNVCVGVSNETGDMFQVVSTLANPNINFFLGDTAPTPGTFFITGASLGAAGFRVDLTNGPSGPYDGTTTINTDQLSFHGKFYTYSNVLSQGWGVPAIYAAARATAQTGNNTSVATYTVGSADGSFIVSGNVNMTAYTAGTLAETCAYTDETSVARTLTFSFSSLTGTLLSAINATGPYEGLPLHIRCKASTAITFKTVGTAFTGTYNVEGVAQQVQ